MAIWSIDSDRRAGLVVYSEGQGWGRGHAQIAAGVRRLRGHTQHHPHRRDKPSDAIGDVNRGGSYVGVRERKREGCG